MVAMVVIKVTDLHRHTRNKLNIAQAKQPNLTVLRLKV